MSFLSAMSRLNSASLIAIFSMIKGRTALGKTKSEIILRTNCMGSIFSIIPAIREILTNIEN